MLSFTSAKPSAVPVALSAWTRVCVVESAVENSGWIVAERLSDPDYMFRITGELVQNNPFIVGSTVAFEPNFFPSKGYYYSAFSYKDGKGGVKRIQQGGKDFKYHGMDWYRIPKENRKSSWCEPYFDAGGAEVMMCTYSVPLINRDGNVYAVLTADISLEDLTRHVSEIKPYPDSYALLSSQEGKPLVAAPADAAKSSDTVMIAGKTSNGWTVELVCPLANILQGARSLVRRIAERLPGQPGGRRRRRRCDQQRDNRRKRSFHDITSLAAKHDRIFHCTLRILLSFIHSAS